MGLSEDRIARIHERAKEIKEERSRRLMRIEAAVSSVLGICLMLLIAVLSGAGGAVQGEVDDTAYAGASLLAPDIGAYILVALVAFFFGVILTVLIRNYMDRHKNDKTDKAEN